MGLTKITNGLEDGRDKDDAEPGGGDVRIRVRRDGDWVGDVVVLTVDFPCEADEVEDAVDNALERTCIDELNEGDCFGDFPLRDEGMFFKAKKDN